MPPNDRCGNPMRWDCLRRGCFNVLKRPKIEVFSECFGCGINFGDVDGIVERRGQFLLLEWKPGPGAVRGGQKMLHDELLQIPKFTIIIVHGDPDTMRVDSFVVRHGASTKEVRGDIDALKVRIRGWYDWADGARAA